MSKRVNRSRQSDEHSGCEKKIYEFQPLLNTSTVIEHKDDSSVVFLDNNVQKKSEKKSKYEKYGIMSDEFFYCQGCSSKISRKGTTAIRNHIKRKHEKWWSEILISESEKEKNNDDVASCKEMFFDSKRNLILFIATTGVPMRVLENKYFKAIIKSQYNVSRSFFTKSLDESVLKLRRHLSLLIPKNFWCLTLDSWCKDDLKIYAYVASFLSSNGPVQFLFDIFQVKKFRTIDIKKTIDYLVEKYNIVRPTVIQSDNDSNMKVLQKLMKTSNMGCVTQIFNLCLKNLIECDKTVAKVVKKYKNLHDLLLISHGYKNQLYALTSDLNYKTLKFFSSTSFNGFGSFLQSLYPYFPFLSSVMDDFRIGEEEENLLKLLIIIFTVADKSIEVTRNISYSLVPAALQNCLDDLEHEILDETKKSETSDTENDDDCTGRDFTSKVISQEDKISLSSSDNESSEKNEYKREKKYGSIIVDKSSIENLKNNAKKMFTDEINLIKSSDFYKKAAFLDPRTAYTQLYTIDTWCEIEREVREEFIKCVGGRNNNPQKKDDKTLFGLKKLDFDKDIENEKFLIFKKILTNYSPSTSYEEFVKDIYKTIPEAFELMSKYYAKGSSIPVKRVFSQTELTYKKQHKFRNFANLVMIRCNSNIFERIKL
uniref:BED-type domain-containing protein n=1 Tax=Strongyloides venezuelensis TaxID=75913 RepID=A0A0K0FR93_STRVS